jgi:RNase P subunit RPR2
MDREYISVVCDECGYLNQIPVRLMYDGYEGLFICENCRSILNSIHEVLDL